MAAVETVSTNTTDLSEETNALNEAITKLEIEERATPEEKVEEKENVDHVEAVEESTESDVVTPIENVEAATEEEENGEEEEEDDDDEVVVLSDEEPTEELEFESVAKVEVEVKEEINTE